MAGYHDGIDTSQLLEHLMERRPRLTQYVVQVARLRMETATVEVDAINDEDAKAEAVELAEHLAKSAWKLERFDASAYRPHVQSMISENELREAAEEEDTSSAEDHVDARQQTRYLLLKADCDLVEGDVFCSRGSSSSSRT